MAAQTSVLFSVPNDLLDIIRSFPLKREVVHCGQRFEVPPFDFYGTCPGCGQQIKVRSFSALAEVEDVFDAVFAWMNQPGGLQIAQERQRVIRDDQD